MVAEREVGSDLASTPFVQALHVPTSISFLNISYSNSRWIEQKRMDSKSE